MKKLILLLLFALAIVSCKKEKITKTPIQPPSQLETKMLGTWNYESVTTVFRDTSEHVIGGATYPNPATSFYQFNLDGTWGSKFVENSLGLNAAGLYRTVADTGFYLLDTGKYAYSLK